MLSDNPAVDGDVIGQDKPAVDSSGGRAVVVGDSVKDSILNTGDNARIFNAGRDVIHAETGATINVFQTSEGLKTVSELIQHSAEVYQAAVRVRTVTAINYQEPGVIDKPKRLFGRDALVADVDRRLDATKRIVLSGFAGMGKTALAAFIADKRLVEGKGPVIWLQAGNEVAEALFEALAECLGAKQAVIGQFGDGKIMALRRLFTQSKTKLLVLDDARNGNALYEALKATPNSLPVLITSRQRFGLEDGEIIEVDQLPPGEALSLLGHYAGQKDYRNDKEAAELCKQLGYHAYALEIAGATLKVDNLAPVDLRQRIADTPHELTMPEDFAEAGREGVKDLLEDSFIALDEESRTVFMAFGAFFAPGATVDLMAAYLECEPKMIEAALVSLMRRSLAKQQPGTNYYYIHDLTFSYTWSKFRAEKQDHQQVARAVQDYVVDHSQHIEHLGLDLPNILGAAGVADQEALICIMSVLTLGGYPKPGEDSYFSQRGHTLDFLEQLDRAIAAAQQLGPDLNKTLDYLLGKRGNAFFERGDYHNAGQMYKAALNLTDAGDRKVKLTSAIGKSLSCSGDQIEARKYFDQGYQLARAMADDSLLSFVLEYESYAAAYNEDFETARRVAAEQVAINERLLQSHPEPDVLEALFFSLLNLGSAQRHLAQQRRQQLEEALAIHDRAKQIADMLGNAPLRAYILGALAEDYDALGERDKAREYFEEALAVWHSRGMTSEEERIIKFLREHGYQQQNAETEK